MIGFHILNNHLPFSSLDAKIDRHGRMVVVWGGGEAYYTGNYQNFANQVLAEINCQHNLASSDKDCFFDRQTSKSRGAIHVLS